MRKREELIELDSCFNKAGMDERMFILLERDPAFVATIDFWINERIRLGANSPGDRQLKSAEALAAVVAARQGRATS